MVRRGEFGDGHVCRTTLAFPQQTDPSKNVNHSGLYHPPNPSATPYSLQKSTFSRLNFNQNTFIDKNIDRISKSQNTPLKRAKSKPYMTIKKVVSLSPTTL